MPRLAESIGDLMNGIQIRTAERHDLRRVQIGIVVIWNAQFHESELTAVWRPPRRIYRVTLGKTHPVGTVFLFRALTYVLFRVFAYVQNTCLSAVFPSCFRYHEGYARPVRRNAIGVAPWIADESPVEVFGSFPNVRAVKRRAQSFPAFAPLIFAVRYPGTVSVYGWRVVEVILAIGAVDAIQRGTVLVDCIYAALMPEYDPRTVGCPRRRGGAQRLPRVIMFTRLHPVTNHAEENDEVHYDQKDARAHGQGEPYQASSENF